MPPRVYPCQVVSSLIAAVDWTDVKGRLGRGILRHMRHLAAIGLAVAILWAVPPSYAGTFTHPTEGWTVTYPTGWDTDASDVRRLGSPFQTCSSPCHVQIVPEGQAEITVRTIPPSTDEHAELDSLMLHSQPVGTQDPQSLRRDYRWGDGTFPYQEAVVAVRKGGKLFLVQLSQQPAPGQSANAYEAAFQSVISSIKVATPVGSRH